MAVSDTSVANSSNFYKGTGIGYHRATGETYWRDLGYLQLVDMTPEVDKTEKYVARGGERTKAVTFVNQTNLSFGVTLLEPTGKNMALLLGGTEAAAVSLATTADTATDTSLTNIADQTGLVDGRRYFISGSGIATGTSFVYDNSTPTSQTLDRATTATAAGVNVTITCPISFTVFSSSQVTGEFMFIGDNSQGPKLRIEAGNTILTPNGTYTLLDSDSTDPAQVPMTLDVYEDAYGNTAQFYWNETTAWVPVLS